MKYKKLKHIRILVIGKVQGVFYRAAAQREANMLGVSGYARKHGQRGVEIHAEAEADKLEEFVEWAWKGSDMSHVKDVRVYEGTMEGYEGFKIK